MIRQATTKDIPAVVGMTERLRASVCSPLEVDPQTTRRFVAGLLASSLAAVWVVDGAESPTGFLAASIGTASISMAPIAVEHGWWAEQGGGLQLLKTYLAWAHDQGCFAVRMSTPPHNERAALILSRIGFEIAEQAWVKVL
jgi:RimJ/RimL family protein N-acetyltransferase